MEPKLGTFIDLETGEEITRELTEEEVNALIETDFYSAGA